MDNNCVKYYPDRTSGYEVMARTRCEQTDRQMERQTDGQTDRQGDSYIPSQTLFWGGGIINTWMLCVSAYL